jgi:type IV secretory pathway VirB10-like protein
MKWIQWGLDNLWTVIIIGTVLVQMFQAVFKKKQDGGTAAGEQPKEFEFEDPELAERTRKIREEIQRKIEQRARGYAEETPRAPEVEAPPPLIHEVPVERPVAASHSSSRLEAQRHAEILEQQAMLEEKLREAQRMKAAVGKRAAFESATADHAPAALSASRRSVMDDLHSPAALRRAFILREVLGPPVALRK